MALQQNNMGPVGYGQPRRGDGMRRRLVRPEDEEMFGPRSQEVEDVRLDQSVGTGQPPQVYPQQPPGIPGGWRQPPVDQGQFGNYGMPGRTPMGGGNDQWGQNPHAQQAYRNAGPPLNADVAGIRNAFATPAGATGTPPAWGQRNGGFNPYGGQQGRPQETPEQWDAERAALPPGQFMNRQRPGTEGPVDPRLASPQSGFGWGGVQNPQYQGGPNQPSQAPPGQYGALQAAAQQSMQGFTDIQGMRDVFKPGQFMGQLEGFNTNAWGSGERGSDTLKNMFGTIASNHDVTQPGALQRALVDIQKALPNATIVSHANEDLLDPDGPNGPLQPVDVIRGATAGGAGAAWQWGPLDQMGAPKPGMNGPQGPSNQMYNNAITQMTPQAGQPGGLAPQVQDENSAMDFLNWLMQQQQQQQPLV